MSNLRMLHTHTQTQFMRHQHKLFLSTSSSGSAVVHLVVSCGQPCSRKVLPVFPVLEPKLRLELEVELVCVCVCMSMCFNLPIVDAQTHLSEMAEYPGLLLLLLLLLDRGDHKLNQHTHTQCRSSPFLGVAGQVTQLQLEQHNELKSLFPLLCCLADCQSQRFLFSSLRLEALRLYPAKSSFALSLLLHSIESN